MERLFTHTAFLLCQTKMLYLHAFLNKQRVIRFIDYNLYQNIFQMTLIFFTVTFLKIFDDIVLSIHIAHTACLLCQTVFFFKNPIFRNRFYHLIEHASRYLFMQKTENGQNVAYCVFTLWARISSYNHASWCCN